MDVGPPRPRRSGRTFSARLARRGLRGVKLVISDAHEGIKASVAKVRTRPGSVAASNSCATCSPMRTQRAACRLRLHRTAFAQDDAEAARQQWRRVADQLRPKVPKLAALMDEAEPDVLAYMGSHPASGQAALHEPAGTPQREIKRRTEVVGIFQRGAITRLVGAILLEQNERVGRPAVPLHHPGSIAPIGDDSPVSLPTLAA